MSVDRRIADEQLIGNLMPPAPERIRAPAAKRVQERIVDARENASDPSSIMGLAERLNAVQNSEL